MPAIAAFLAFVIIGVLTYVIAAVLWSGDPSEPYLVPILIALLVGSISAVSSYKAEVRKAARKADKKVGTSTDGSFRKETQ